MRTLPLLCLLMVPVLASAQDEARDRYAAAAKYSFDHGGLSILIHYEGQPVFEEYAEGRSAEQAHVLFSGTKSFFGVAVACMIQDGLIESLDELACATLQEWKEDPRKRTITIRHLLHLTSGLDPSDAAALRRKVRDTYAHAVKLPCVADPGASYAYGPANFYALGALMQAKLDAKGKDADPLAYLQRRILDPIGLKVARWSRDEAGHPRTPSGAFLTAREWIKFGELVRNEGAWGEQQIVDAKHLAACFAGSKANPGYGLTWWLPTEGGLDPRGLPAPPVDAPKDTVMAAGAANQRLYVIPSLQLVVVRQANNDRDWSDAEFLRLLLGKSAPDAKSRADWLAERAKAEAKQQLEKYDADRDGVVSLEEAPRLVQRFFRFLDRDGSGDLDLSELEASARRRLERRE